jgi:hypothetical protein
MDTSKPDRPEEAEVLSSYASRAVTTAPMRKLDGDDAVWMAEASNVTDAARCAVHDGLDRAARVASRANHRIMIFFGPLFHIAGPRNTPGETSRTSSCTCRM